MILLNDVSKQYSIKNNERVIALCNVDLKIDKGDFITVIGASGSGKSTLLFTIGGMLAPTEGAVSFKGTDMYALDQNERAGLRKNKIGFVFQTFNLVPYLTCIENVALPAIINGSPTADAFPRAKKMLEKMGLGRRLHHKPSRMSVGERQRAAIMRSMINDPEILLADEPTGNLDPDTTCEVMNIFREQNGMGRTVVMVTHNHDLARAGNRIISIDKGIVTEERTPAREEVHAR